MKTYGMQLKQCLEGNVDIKKGELSQINNLTSHFKTLGKNANQKEASERKEIIRIRAEMNETKNGKTVEKDNEAKSWFLEKSAKLTKL